MPFRSFMSFRRGSVIVLNFCRSSKLLAVIEKKTYSELMLRPTCLPILVVLALSCRGARSFSAPPPAATATVWREIRWTTTRCVSWTPSSSSASNRRHSTYAKSRIRHYGGPLFSSSELENSSIKEPSERSAPGDLGSPKQSYDAPNEKSRVVVVGGGVGGLAVAARIAAALCDAKVTVLEKNARVGGRCGSFWVDVGDADRRRRPQRIRHERGPSLLLLPDVYRQLFAETTGGAKSAEDYGLEMAQCVPAYQVVFEDGDCMSVGFPAKAATAENDSSIRPQREESRAKMNSYEPNGADKWDEYMTITSAYLDCGLPNFIEERLDLASFYDFLVQSLRDSAKAWPLKPHSDVLDAIFESDKLKALASFQDLYVGLEPYRNSELFAGGVLRSTAPAVFGLLAAIELHPTNRKAGVFAPIGGFQAVSTALERLAGELGVEIRCNTTVSHIENNGVYIRDASGRHFVEADLLIVNADLPYAKKSLVKDRRDTNEQSTESQPSPLMEIYDWDDNFSFSSGVVSFHWSVETRVDALKTHNVFLMAGSRSVAEASWQVLRPSKQQMLSSDDDDAFNFYVHRPTATDPSAAPYGYDSIMVLVPCKTLLREEECSKLTREVAIARYRRQFSDKEISRLKVAVLKRLGAIESLKNLEMHIVHEVVDHPATWADQFNLAAGTPFAMSHGFAQLSFTRPGPRSSGLSNVLYCGAGTRPGNGVPLVLIGAKQVAKKAIQDFERKLSADAKAYPSE